MIAITDDVSTYEYVADKSALEKGVEKSKEFIIYENPKITANKNKNL